MEDTDSVTKIQDAFKDDLPSIHNFPQEVERWVFLWEDIPLKDRPQSLKTSLQVSQVNIMYPNITTIFELLITLPVGSVLNERSFSSLRRLKTWCRSTMGEERLNGLALLHIHQRDRRVDSINPEMILKRFDPSGSLRIGKLF